MKKIISEVLKHSARGCSQKRAEEVKERDQKESVANTSLNKATTQQTIKGSDNHRKLKDDRYINFDHVCSYMCIYMLATQFFEPPPVLLDVDDSFLYEKLKARHLSLSRWIHACLCAHVFYLVVIWLPACMQNPKAGAHGFQSTISLLATPKGDPIEDADLVAHGVLQIRHMSY